MDYLLHFVIDITLMALGYGVRTTCAHRGLFPHPARDISISVLLSAATAIITVPLIG